MTLQCSLCLKMIKNSSIKSYLTKSVFKIFYYKSFECKKYLIIDYINLVYLCCHQAKKVQSCRHIFKVYIFRWKLNFPHFWHVIQVCFTWLLKWYDESSLDINWYVLSFKFFSSKSCCSSNFILAGFLYGEIGVTLILLIPFISNKTWRKLFKSRFLKGIENQFVYYFYILVAILILFFLGKLINF